jgi:uncharacterized protein with PIN domain
MLGRLAKWLRLLGIDTVYAGRLSDHQIAAIARAEGRVVLTRDREMTRRKGIRSLYVDSQVLDEQLVQIVGELGLSLEGESERRPARCSVCNQPLVRVSRDEARSQVPPYVWQTQSLFHRCPKCERIFWPGTHWEHIQETIERTIG